MRNKTMWVGMGVVIGLLLATAGMVLAGALNPTVGPSEAASQMYTLEQIYDRLFSGAAGTKMTTFTEPAAGPVAGTMHTLDEIMAAAPEVDANGVTAAEVAAGKTFWGLTSGAWGLQTGTASGGGGVGVPKTGQTTYYATGDDGDLEKGVPWPNPRFTDNGDGTVTDNLTGLLWLKNANCFGQQAWANALSSANNLASGSCGLTDGSVAGDWRLPNVRELHSLIHYGYVAPALPNTAGTGKWTEDNPFTGVQTGQVYWSASTYAYDKGRAWIVDLSSGAVLGYFRKDPSGGTFYVWPVRGSGGGDGAPKTGQTLCYDASGSEIPCAGTGQDGEYQAGVDWYLRFTDNEDGTVTDNLTGLIWLKNANCFGVQRWSTALTYANTLNSGECGLSDGSNEGDWRLPNVRELHSLINFRYSNLALPNTAGTGQWGEGSPFTGVQSDDYYWSSTTYASNTANAYYVLLGSGEVNAYSKSAYLYV